MLNNTILRGLRGRGTQLWMNESLSYVDQALTTYKELHQL